MPYSQQTKIRVLCGFLSIWIVAMLPSAGLRGDDTLESLKAELSSGDRGKIVSAISRVERERLEALYKDVYQAFAASKDETVRRHALFSLSRCGAPQVLQMVREAIDDPKATNVGIRHLGAYELALQRIAQTNDDEIIFPAIRKAIQDPDVYYRKYGSAALASYPPAIREFADQFSELANDPSPVVRYTLLGKLTGASETTELVVPVLLQALRGVDAGDRIAAAFALAKFQDWPAQHPDQSRMLVELLVSELGYAEPERAGAAGYALVFLRAWPNVLTSVKAALAEGSPRSVVFAASVLHEAGETFDPQLLEPAIADGDEEVQLRAVFLLARQPSLAGIRLLERALASDSASVRNAAVFGLRACGWIGEFAEVGTKPNGRPVSTLVVKSNRAEEEEARLAAASRVLAAAQSSPDKTVARLASDALVRIGAESMPVDQLLIDYDRWRQQAGERKQRTLNDVAGKAIEQQDVLAIGSQKQLFIDDFIVDRLDGVQRVAHAFEKHPANPIFHAQAPWEENWVDNFMCSVHYDSDTRDFKMWYRCGANHTLGGFAVSADGIQWHRPNLGRVEYKGSRNNNLLGWKTELYRDAHQPGHNVSWLPDAPPEKRYLSFFDYSGEKRGFYVSYSPDGIAWSPPEHAQVVYGDVATLIPDPIRGGFLLFPKQARWVDGYRRSFGFTHIKTVDAYGPKTYPFTALTKKHDELVGRQAARSFDVLARGTIDPSDGAYYCNWHTQIYSVTPVVYEGLVLGFYDLWYLTGHKEGPLEMLLMASRDLKTWHDVGFPQAMLPPGRPGEWDAGMVYGGSNILVVDDEIRLYYAGFNLGHYTDIPWGSQPHQVMGVGLATLRLDGFVSARAEQKGTLTTKPFTFTGKKLIVNVDADDGEVRVEILDVDGKPLPGFMAAACHPIDRDSIRQTVSWSDRSDVSLLGGTEVRLRFLMQNADLYSFQFSRE